MRTHSESEDNKLLVSAAFLMAELLGVMKKQKSEKNRKEPFWKKWMKKRRKSRDNY